MALCMRYLLQFVHPTMWEEIVFFGFLFRSFAKCMFLWSSILVSSVAFALARFSVQRMLPLGFLGIIEGVAVARTRNLLASILLHSLWNALLDGIGVWKIIEEETVEGTAEGPFGFRPLSSSGFCPLSAFLMALSFSDTCGDLCLGQAQSEVFILLVISLDAICELHGSKLEFLRMLDLIS